jgi:hypothetical protein
MRKIRKQYPVAIVHEDFTRYLMQDLQSPLGCASAVQL